MGRRQGKRYERIVQDTAAFRAEILLTSGGSADREQGLHSFTGSFEPGEVLEIAKRTDEKLRGIQTRREQAS